VDLGDSVLMPGLINAHCHLDYTDMAGQIPQQRSFSDWIKSIVSLKADWNYTEFASSWIKGARMLVRNGATTVIDIEAVPELLPDVLETTALRVFSALELISLRGKRTSQQMVADALARINTWPNERTGLSPHAPYTTSRELLATTALEGRRRERFLTTHVAESQEEFDMFAHARGTMFDWLAAQRDMSDCGSKTPVEVLANAGMLGPDFLAVHCNYVTKQDIKLLAASGSNVIHCPRSHRYFNHAPFPYKDFREAGIRICLGTDSMASVHRLCPEMELDMFAEMRSFAAASASVPAEEIIQLCTANPAAALGMSKDLGEIRAGARADLIALPFDPHQNAFDSVLNHRGPVYASMIGGRWTMAPSI